MESLIANGTSVNFKHGDLDYTPLHYSAKTGHEKVLSILLNNEANVNALSKENETALNVGIEKGENLHQNTLKLASNICRFFYLGRSKIIYFLIEKGGDVNLVNEKGESPLHRAVKYGTIKIRDN